MPIVDGESITYDFKPGVFTLALPKTKNNATFKKVQEFIFSMKDEYYG